MEITKEEIENLLGQKVKDYKVEKIYEGDNCIKIKIDATPEKVAETVKITIKPTRFRQA